MNTTIKKPLSCLGINDYKLNTAIIKSHQPVAGDVAVFEVVKIGSLSTLQDLEGKNRYIFEGDRIMAVFGNRYASNQFEGYVPTSFQEEYDFMGKGGVVGTVTSMYHKLELMGPTKLRLIGYATNEKNEVINTIEEKSVTTTFDASKKGKYKTILSIGASMDSGKTTSAAYLCRGLKAAGNTVAFIKLTGTVFNKDKVMASDCGADIAIDFSEFGFPSTYLCSLGSIRDLYGALLNQVEEIAPDYVVIEIADGILQRETDMLISDEAFMSTIDHVLFSTGDSLSAMQGVETLRSKKITPFALSGMINTRPLLVDEVNRNLRLPLLNLEDLSSACIENYFINTHVGTTATPENAPLKRRVLEVA